MQSVARDNVGIVAVMFKLDTNFDTAADEVRQKVDAIAGRLPSGAEKPIISKADIGAAPILVYAASAPRPSEEVRRITEDTVKPALERLDGVAKVEVLGGREREVHVDLDRVRLESFGLSPLAVVEKLRAENATNPAGHYGPNVLYARAASGELGQPRASHFCGLNWAPEYPFQCLVQVPHGHTLELVSFKFLTHISHLPSVLTSLLALRKVRFRESLVGPVVPTQSCACIRSLDALHVVPGAAARQSEAGPCGDILTSPHGT